MSLDDTLRQLDIIIEQYQVTWGGITEIVLARDEGTAWALFCDKVAPGNPDLARFPKLHPRIIERVDDVQPVQFDPDNPSSGLVYGGFASGRND
jgi:hypothetical protein